MSTATRQSPFRSLTTRLRKLCSPRNQLLLIVLAALMLGGACARKRPVKVVYLNRPFELNMKDKRALTVAMEEVANWDAGAQVIDHRVQSHSRGYTVSLLIAASFDEQGQPQYDKSPIRNVEINREWEVTGYHISR